MRPYLPVLVVSLIAALSSVPAMATEAVIGTQNDQGVARAPQWIVQTGCDTLSLDPLQLQVQFELVNWGLYDWIDHISIQENYDLPHCPILACGSPPEWFCGTSGGIATWTTNAEQGVAPGGTRGGFTLVFSGPLCWYTVLFYDQPLLEPVYFQSVCFECQVPVPTRPSTWGQLKAIYR
jgi:hypothetical protein